MLFCVILYFCAQTLPDFQVNTEDYPAKAVQNYPAIAGYDSGCVVVWLDSRVPNFGPDIYCVLQNMLGDTSSMNFRLNDDTTSSCAPFPDVHCDFHGNFGVAWKQGYAIKYRAFSRDGAPTGPSVTVNEYSAYCSAPAIALDSAGYAAVTWSDDHAYNGYRVYGQIYNPAGSPVGTNFLVSDSSQNPPMLTDVEIDDSRSIVAIWHYGNSLWCQQFDSLGNRIGGNLTLWTDTMNIGINYPIIERNAGGDYLLVWCTTQSGDVFCRLFDSTLTPLGGVTKVNDATVVEAWRPRAETKDSMWFIAFVNDQSEIYLQRIAYDGTLIGNNFRISEPAGYWNLFPGVAPTSDVLSICWARRNTYFVWHIMSQKASFHGDTVGSNMIITDDIGGSPQYLPAIAADTTGDFFVVWDDFRDPEYMSSSQYGRRFDASGNPFSEDFRINEHIDAQGSAISLNSLGLYVTSWSKNMPDSNSQIHGQRFDRNGTFLGPNFQISMAPGLSPVFHPRITALSDNQFVVIWTDSRIIANRIYGRFLDPLGIPHGNEFSVYVDSTVDNLACSIVDEENGKFIIAMSCSHDSTGAAIQELDYNGNVISPVIVLNEIPGTNAFVSGAKGQGRYLFAWDAQDSLRRVIRGQFIDENLQSIGGNFKISDDTSSYKEFPNVVSNQSGQFFVVWCDGRNGNYDIYGQFIDPWGNLIGNNFKVDNDTTNSEQWLPAAYSANDLIYLVWSDTRIPAHWFDVYCKVVNWPQTHIAESKQENLTRCLTLSPNPFRQKLHIGCNLTQNAHGKPAIDIYDACGRLVRHLKFPNSRKGTTKSIEWDGKDGRGNILPAGVYFVIFLSETETAPRKAVKLR